MNYRLLGRSGVRVSELALGTMTFGEDWGWGASREESERIFDAYVEAGGNFIDTANNYTDGTSPRRRLSRGLPLVGERAPAHPRRDVRADVETPRLNRDRSGRTMG